MSVAEQAQVMAEAWIRGLAAQLTGSGYQLAAAGIVLGSGRPEFTLKQALATHAAMHNAEGWLFREAVMRAADEYGLRMTGAVEAAVYERAAVASGLTAGGVEQRVRELGRETGPPWGKDQKLAAAAAWLALAQAQPS